MKQTSSNQNFKQPQKWTSYQLSCRLLFLLLALICTTSLFAQQSSNCSDAVLDFSKSKYEWPSGSLHNNFEVHNQHFNIAVIDADHIVQHVQEAGAGLKIGINPGSVNDMATIVYNLSQYTSNVKFSISDLDYKKYGAYASNQQEAVRIVGYCNGVKVLPKLRSISGSVDIKGNYAVATSDSKYGYDESIEVVFSDCINQIKIEYGTGPNSPVANPSYGKIYIGKIGGVLASTCNSTCNGCAETCTKSILNFNNEKYNWQKNSLSGQYTINDQSIDISIVDNDHILQDTEAYYASLKVGIDPKTKDDVVEVRYKLSQTSDAVKFVIRDLDYKHYGHNKSNQQEKVCVIGYRNGMEVLPDIKSLEGSVHINGNCAEAMANSAHGYDESIEICFNECIDEVLIVYGSGSKVPVHNPTYSKIYIGDNYGFLTGYCEDTCIDCELVVDSEPNISICPGETIELTTEVSGISDCENCHDQLLAYWNMDHCNSAGQAGNKNCSTNAPEVASIANLQLQASAPCRSFANFSCRPGYEGQSVCFPTINGGYTTSTNKTISFTAALNPSNGYEANLTAMEFYVSSVDGLPINYGIRILRNGVEIYEKINFNLEGQWKKHGFDFKGLNSFLVTEATTFTFEILGYNGGKAIELDEIKLYGNTCNVSSQNGGVNYLWSTGETTPTIMVSEAGIYEVRVNDCHGCMATRTIEVIAKPKDIVSVSTEDNILEICEGFSLDISATSNAENLVWSTGESGASITVTPAETTTYTVTASSLGKCPAVDSAIVKVTNLDLGEIYVDPITCEIPTAEEQIKINIVEVAENDALYDHYFIFVCQPKNIIKDYIKYSSNDIRYEFIIELIIDFEYSIHSYVVDSSINTPENLDNLILNNGTLNDVYLPSTNQAPCAKLDFDGERTINEGCDLLRQSDINKYKVYPNPATNKLYFSNLSLENLVSLNITNIKGQILKDIPFDDKIENLVIDVKDMQAGIYLLNVQTALNVSSTKIIIN